MKEDAALGAAFPFRSICLRQMVSMNIRIPNPRTDVDKEAVVPVME